MTTDSKKKYGGILLVEADKSMEEKYDIIAAITENGNCPFFDDFFLPLAKKYNESMEKKVSLNKKDQINYRTLDNYFKKFSKTGPWNNKRQLRSLEDGFFEFKNIKTGLRVIFYYDEINRGVIILTHYFEKGGQKTPSSEKERMRQIKISFDKYRKLSGD
ncbi:MAG: hypothetical protein GY754_27570 [bacterium]|nr:hypothetical protein [bacterium]